MESAIPRWRNAQNKAGPKRGNLEPFAGEESRTWDGIVASPVSAGASLLFWQAGRKVDRRTPVGDKKIAKNLFTSVMHLRQTLPPLLLPPHTRSRDPIRLIELFRRAQVAVFLCSFSIYEEGRDEERYRFSIAIWDRDLRSGGHAADDKSAAGTVD
jgi:hypothetical protein